MILMIFTVYSFCSFSSPDAFSSCFLDFSIQQNLQLTSHLPTTSHGHLLLQLLATRNRSLPSPALRPGNGVSVAWTRGGPAWTHRATMGNAQCCKATDIDPDAAAESMPMVESWPPEGVPLGRPLVLRVVDVCWSFLCWWFSAKSLICDL